MSTFTIADSFDATLARQRVDLDAPLPLGYTAAVRRAIELRGKGTTWSYATIADVMGEYHGFRRSSSWWQKELRGRGCPARPLGVPFYERVAA